MYEEARREDNKETYEFSSSELVTVQFNVGQERKG